MRDTASSEDVLGFQPPLTLSQNLYIVEMLALPKCPVLPRQPVKNAVI